MWWLDEPLRAAVESQGRGWRKGDRTSFSMLRRVKVRRIPLLGSFGMSTQARSSCRPRRDQHPIAGPTSHVRRASLSSPASLRADSTGSGSTFLSLYLPTYLSACLAGNLSVCLSVCLSVYLSIYLSISPSWVSVPISSHGTIRPSSQRQHYACARDE